MKSRHLVLFSRTRHLDNDVTEISTQVVDPAVHCAQATEGLGQLSRTVHGPKERCTPKAP